jgi:hypothetical protein
MKIVLTIRPYAASAFTTRSEGEAFVSRSKTLSKTVGSKSSSLEEKRLNANLADLT